MDSGRFETQFFAGLLLFAVAVMLFVFYPCLEALVLAVTLAVIFHPVYGGLRRVMPRWEGVAAFITVILATAVILAPLTIFGLQIFKEAQGLYAHFASGEKSPLLELLYGRFNKFLPGLNLNFGEYARQILGTFLGNLGIIFSKIIGVFGTFFLALFALYYLLKDGPKLCGAIVKISPLAEKTTAEIIDRLRLMANSVIVGTLTMSVIHGTLVGFGFFLFGLTSPVLWGLVAVIAALIPVVGTAIVVVPGIILLALAGKTTAAVGLALWGILMLGLIDNILRPRIIERRSKAHPLLVLLSVIGGLALFGPTGLLLGPLALTLLLTLLEIYPAIAAKYRPRR